MQSRIFKNKFFIIILSACIFAICSFAGVRAVFPLKYYSEISTACKNTGIPPRLVLAIIKTESSFDNEKVSPKGAIGLMQIMPSTASYVSSLFFANEEINLCDAKQNISVGVSYLIYLFDKFEDKKTVLSAYNAGEGRVYDWLENYSYSKDGKALDYIPFKETASYVEKVLHAEKIYSVIYCLS